MLHTTKGFSFSRQLFWLAPLGIAFFLTICTPSYAKKTSQPQNNVHVLQGNASFYSDTFQGKKTASGEIFDQQALTAAHKTLPFGTMVRVTNTRNGKKVTVRINDRGPFISGRVIDLSRAAAQQIDMITAGVAPVRVEIAQGKSAE